MHFCHGQKLCDDRSLMVASVSMFHRESAETLSLLHQGEELEPARAKAEKMGIKRIYIDDLREVFVKDYVFPMFRWELGRVSG